MVKHYYATSIDNYTIHSIECDKPPLDQNCEGLLALRAINVPASEKLLEFKSYEALVKDVAYQLNHKEIM